MTGATGAAAASAGDGAEVRNARGRVVIPRLKHPVGSRRRSSGRQWDAQRKRVVSHGVRPAQIRPCRAPRALEKRAAHGKTGPARARVFQARSRPACREATRARVPKAYEQWLEP